MTTQLESNVESNDIQLQQQTSTSQRSESDIKIILDQNIQEKKSRKGFNGKEQFGDKSICRICTLVVKIDGGYVNCNRCHFKYHYLCIEQQTKEPQIIQGQKWICLKCQQRIEKNILLGKQNKKHKKYKNKLKNIIENNIINNNNNNNNKTIDQQEIIKNILNRFPQYEYNGQIQYPILDEYLIIFDEHFHFNLKSKPIIQKEQQIPQEYYNDILNIWNTYNYYDRIISDLIDQNDIVIEQNYQIGTMIHFQNNHIQYQQKSRNEIYQIIKNNSMELIKFFILFYVKQIVEDIDQEQLTKQHYSNFWRIFVFLWQYSRSNYYLILFNSLQEIIQELQELGLIQIIKQSNNLDNKIQEDINIIISLIDGLRQLKKTQQMIQNRYDIMTSTKQKINQTEQIKNLREYQLEQNKKQNILEQQSKELNELIETINESKELSKEYDKIMKEYELVTKQLQQHKQDGIEIFKKLYIYQQRFNLIGQDLKQQQIQNLMMNQSLFLGYDNIKSEYYYFCNEQTKIFVNKKYSYVSNDNSEWGYYDFNQCVELLKSLSDYGSKEQQLKNNLQDLIQSNLLMHEQSNIQENNEKIDPKLINQLNIKQSKSIQQEITIEKLINIFKKTELNLTIFLNEKNFRWCSTIEREKLIKTFENEYQDHKPLQKAVLYFIENAQIQERLELKKDDEIIQDDYQNIINEEEQIQYIPKKHKIIEDNEFEKLEQMDSKKIKYRKYSMRLFSSNLEELRESIQQLLKNDSCTFLELKVCIYTIKYAVHEYIKKRQIEIQKSIEKQEKKRSQINLDEILNEVQNNMKETNKQQQQQQQQQHQEQKVKVNKQCKICLKPGKTVTCDKCNIYTHVKCMKIDKLEKGIWRCQSCQQSLLTKQQQI